MKKYASIDIGGTAIKYGLIDETGTILCRMEQPTQAWLGGSAVLEKAVQIVENFLKTEILCGICISTAGMVDTERGEIFYASPLIPDYTGTKFKETMERRFGLPCEVENDVNCAGLAEYKSGASKGSRIAVMLTVGTGIGGSMICDGKIFRGYSGSACEIGYMHMDGSDFQTLGAASILTAKAAQRKGEPEENWDGRAVFEAAKAGDPICLEVIDEMTEVLGTGIANICYVVNPEIVVLGGGIMAQEAFLKERIEKTVQKKLVPSIAQHTKIAFAKHRNDAGMLGAFWHFMQKQEAER